MNKIIITVGFQEACTQEASSQAKHFGFKLENHKSIEDISLSQITERKYTRQFVVIAIDNAPYEAFKFAANLKEYELIETIFISKSATPDERVRWLSFGVCNYFTEPYNIEEIFRFTSFLANPNSFILSDDKFIVDLKSREVLYMGERIEVTDRLVSLIVYMMEKNDSIISREELAKNVFSVSNNKSIRSVDSSIKDLRKLTDYNIVTTIRGQGYRYDS